jgi:hypothetical protein
LTLGCFLLQTPESGPLFIKSTCFYSFSTSTDQLVTPRLRPNPGVGEDRCKKILRQTLLTLGPLLLRRISLDHQPMVAITAVEASGTAATISQSGSTASRLECKLWIYEP